jgi:hypothetical protein
LTLPTFKAVSKWIKPRAADGNGIRRGGWRFRGPTKRRVDGAAARADHPFVNINQIEEAVHRGVPFRLKVADGDEFRVPHADYIFLPPRSSAKRTYVMVHNDQGFASVLPLLTITSLTYQFDAENWPERRIALARSGLRLILMA